MVCSPAVVMHHSPASPSPAVVTHQSPASGGPGGLFAGTSIRSRSPTLPGCHCHFVLDVLPPRFASLSVSVDRPKATSGSGKDVEHWSDGLYFSFTSNVGIFEKFLCFVLGHA